MPTKSTPLDTLKHTVLRATESIDGATNNIAGSICDHDHEKELVWFDSVKHGLWLAIVEQVPGITWNGEEERPEFTAEGKLALKTYDDGSPVVLHLASPNGHYATDYYPRFDGPYEPFAERFEDWCVIREAEGIAYEAVHPAADEGAK